MQDGKRRSRPAAVGWLALVLAAAVPPAVRTTEAAPLPAKKGGDEADFEIARGVKVRFCWVPAGTAQLGSPKEEREYVNKILYKDKIPDVLDDEAEARRGRFATAGFWLGKYEVTQAEWVAATDRENPSFYDSTKDNLATEYVKGLDTRRFPVESVSWEDVVEFCNRASAHAGRTPRYGKGADGKWAVVGPATGFRLPHEDEWEYACRGGLGNRRPFYFGDVSNADRANVCGEAPYGTTEKGAYLRRTTEVGEYAAKAPHPWGLCDMHGNVWEWCENSYHGKYTFDLGQRAMRGGSWWQGGALGRSADRAEYEPAKTNMILGFRLLLPPD